MRVRTPTAEIRLCGRGAGPSVDRAGSGSAVVASAATGFGSRLAQGSGAPAPEPRRSVQHNSSVQTELVAHRGVRSWSGTPTRARKASQATSGLAPRAVLHRGTGVDTAQRRARRRPTVRTVSRPHGLRPSRNRRLWPPDPGSNPAAPDLGNPQVQRDRLSGLAAEPTAVHLPLSSLSAENLCGEARTGRERHQLLGP